MSGDLDAIKAMKFTTGLNVACGPFVEGAEERALYEEAARHHNARIVLVAKVERLQAALARVEALIATWESDPCDDHNCPGCGADGLEAAARDLRAALSPAAERNGDERP